MGTEILGLLVAFYVLTPWVDGFEINWLAIKTNSFPFEPQLTITLQESPITSEIYSFNLVITDTKMKEVRINRLVHVKLLVF